MPYIHAITLGKPQREALRTRALPLEQVEQLYAAIKRADRGRVRGFKRAAIITTVISVALLAMTVSITGFTGAAVAACVGILAVVCLALGATWFLSIALYRKQFNDALMEGYPEFASRHQL